MVLANIESASWFYGLYEVSSVDENKIQLFEDKRIRMAWDEENEEWLLSIVDIIGVLTEQPTQRGATLYWGKLKQRLKAEGSQLLTKCQQLKMTAEDGGLLFLLFIETGLKFATKNSCYFLHVR